MAQTLYETARENLQHIFQGDITPENFPSHSEREILEFLSEISAPETVHGNKGFYEIIEQTGLRYYLPMEAAFYPDGSRQGSGVVWKDYGYKAVFVSVEFKYYPPDPEKGLEAAVYLYVSNWGTEFDPVQMWEMIEEAKRTLKIDGSTMTLEGQVGEAVFDLLYHFSQERGEREAFLEWESKEGQKYEVHVSLENTDLPICVVNIDSDEEENIPLQKIFNDLVDAAYSTIM